MLLNMINSMAGVLEAKGVQTTSFVFRLITKYTLNLFIVFVTFLCTTALFGDPLECFTSTSDGKIDKAFSLICWVQGLYIDKNMLKGSKGRDIVNYGVGPRNSSEPNLVFFKFYQWIIPLLMLQAFFLYIPRGIWRMQEKGTMMCLLHDTYCPVFTEEWDKKKKELVTYMKDVRKKYHRQYALKYLLCEFLTIAVIIFNMFILKYVVTDFWSEYQPAVVAFFTGNFVNFNREASRLFPTQAKCIYFHTGPSGTIVERDALCVLSQNVVNEKIFVFIYIWYIILLILAILNVLYLLVMYTFKILRIINVGHMLERKVTIRECKEISSNGDIGLWFTLTIFRKNLVSIYFQDVCKDLLDKLKSEKASSHLEYEDMDKYS